MTFSILDYSVLLCHGSVDCLLCLEMPKACCFKLCFPGPFLHLTNVVSFFSLFPLVTISLPNQSRCLHVMIHFFLILPCLIASSTSLTQTLPGSYCLPRRDPVPSPLQKLLSSSQCDSLQKEDTEQTGTFLSFLLPYSGPSTTV